MAWLLLQARERQRRKRIVEEERGAAARKAAAEKLDVAKENAKEQRKQQEQRQRLEQRRLQEEKNAKVPHLLSSVPTFENVCGALGSAMDQHPHKRPGGIRSGLKP